MMDRITRNAFWWIASISALLIACLTVLVPPTILTQCLNGVFIGMGFAVLWVFRRLIKMTVWSREEFDDVRMFAMSLLMGGFSMTVMKANAIWYFVNGYRNPLLSAIYTGNFATYCAILAGAGMILSPGLNHGYLHGEDKRTVWGAIIFGLTVAGFLIYIQLSTDNL